ncbi:hypothetical protein CASFOL_006203 [Castilleja foliolosa]|uniref:Uncharacterized protein n=1 Tax=Castilleja foliolosa TaxID=1961234 RepID=A0ABD3E5P6_9LAMI
MENGAMMSKDDMKVEIASLKSSSPVTSPVSNGGVGRQESVSKHSCLCSPTTHVGSFRCRLHRSPSLRRTTSIDSTNN